MRRAAALSSGCIQSLLQAIREKVINLCVLPQVAQPPPVMGRGILEQGPFPGSILVAAAAVLAGAGFIGSKLYKAKAPEVRKVRRPLRDCLKRGSALQSAG